MYFPQQGQLPYQPSAMSSSAAAAAAAAGAGATSSAPRPFPVAYNNSPHILPMTSRPAGSTIEDSSRIKRPRKERACDLCRRKKIRCDFTQAYPYVPCSSCKGYGKTCTFNEAAKKRGPPKGYVEGLESRLRRMEELLVNLVDSGKPLPEGYQELLGSRAQKSNSSSSSSSSSEDKQTNRDNDKETEDQKDHAGESNSSAPSGYKKVSSATVDDSKSLPQQARQGPDYSYYGGSSGVYLLAKLFQTENTSAVLPVAEDDVMVPNRSDHAHNIFVVPSAVWSFPDKEIVNRLVNVYFEKMNIFLPIIDEDEFRSQYEKDMNSIWPPLLAVLCRAGSRLLDEDDSLLKKHRITGDDLFNLFTNQIENNKPKTNLVDPRIEFVQFFLLFANSTNGWGFNSKEWVCISIAAKMAQDLGLHRASNSRRRSQRQNEYYKRLWWSAYAMDRWVSTSMGRPLSISDADCDVDLPAVEDSGCNYSFLVAIVKLSGILGDIARVLYSPRSRSLGCEKHKGIDQICANFAEKLEEWRFNLPPQLRVEPSDEEHIRSNLLSDELDHRFNNGAGQLHLAYFSTLILLKQHSHNTNQSMLETEASRTTFLSAENIIHVLAALRPKTCLIVSSAIISFALFQSVSIILAGLSDSNAELVSKSKKLLRKFRTICARFSDYIPQDLSRTRMVEDLERFIDDVAAAAIATATTTDEELA